MRRTFTATYDGESLRPSSALDLVRDRRYVITVEEAPETRDTGDAWSELASLVGTVDGPPDWAREHDHYLYGSPKRDRDGAGE